MINVMAAKWGRMDRLHGTVGKILWSIYLETVAKSEKNCGTRECMHLVKRGHFWVLWRRWRWLHSICHNQKPHITLWPPNSPDLNPVDYSVWGILQEKVYKTSVTDLDELTRLKTATENGMGGAENISVWRWQALVHLLYSRICAVEV